MNQKTLLTLAAVAIGALVLTFLQLMKINRLQREVSALHSQPTAVSYGSGLGAPSARLEASIENLEYRLQRLEFASTEFSGVIEVLQKQGDLPLQAETIASLKVQLQNPDATDQDRFRALRLLRGTQNLSDDLFYDVLAWLQTATNAHTRRTLVSRLKDFPNADYRQPLLELLDKEDSLAVRYQIIASLHPFRGDSQVEDRLWQLSQNDPDRRLRELALQELAKGQLTSERIAALQANAMRPDLPLEDQLQAFRTLRNAQAISPAVLDKWIDLAGRAEDPSRRAKILSALDGVTDERIKVPLVQGLQDPSPVVRERAAHILGRFAHSDARIREWLIYVSQNDSDPEVQREAHRMLEREPARPVPLPGLQLLYGD
jgi:hypothetical protein